MTDSDDRLLLAHQRSWAPGRFSVLAGFVEAGESVEQTVHREVSEEVGIAVKDVTYVASQPWPFPRSLMFAYRATAVTTEITVDGIEIEQAQFFTREEVRRNIAEAKMTLAGPGSVSSQLITTWLEQG
ncbi:MAG: NAD(+) diphosphatase [Propionibacteriaceae bacterium]